jgi:hypothetical protein
VLRKSNKTHKLTENQLKMCYGNQKKNSSTLCTKTELEKSFSHFHVNHSKYKQKKLQNKSHIDGGRLLKIKPTHSIQFSNKISLQLMQVHSVNFFS